MTNDKKEFTLTAEDAIKMAIENTANEAQPNDEYPVYFEEGVDFMGTGIRIHNFGEIVGCCSEKLMELAHDDTAFTFSIWDAVRRFLTGDFGDVSAELAKRAEVDFREGLPILCKYKNFWTGEGEIWLAVDELGHPENPRFIYALLPSEQKAIEEWYEAHPEEIGGSIPAHFALLINLH